VGDLVGDLVGGLVVTLFGGPELVVTPVLGSGISGHAKLVVTHLGGKLVVTEIFGAFSGHAFWGAFRGSR
jgi:hypothetical protein